MKKNLLKLALIALVFVSPFISNGQVSVFFPSGATTAQADICAGTTSGGMAVIYNTTSGSTTSVAWSILSGPVDATLGTATTNQSNSINTLTAGSLSGTATIQVIISNDMGSSTTKLFTIEILALPTTATLVNTGSEVLCPGGSGSTLNASSTGANSYLWYKDGTVISGVTGPSHTAMTAGDYTVKGANDCGIGVVSNTITLTDGITTTIDSQPSDVNLMAGQTTASFSITASGTNLTYQWYMNGAAISDGGDFMGTTTSTLNIISNAATYSGNNFACFVDGDCGSATFSMQAVLPIDLISFEGKFVDDYATLAWATASEYNNSFFAIERSYDGKEFTAIAKIEGAGESNEILDYTFEDYNVLNRAASNTAYYRLKQVDFDGNYSYSDVISVNIIKKGAFEITNVIQEAQNINLFLTSKSNTTLDLTVYNLNGQVVAQKNVEAIEGYNRFDLNVDSAAKGLYIISVVGETSNITRKVFIK